MVIIIRKGKVKTFRDGGSLENQLKNLDALVQKVHYLAAAMHITADFALSVDPQLAALNRDLQKQIRAAHNTISLADKQLDRNIKKQEVAQAK